MHIIYIHVRMTRHLREQGGNQDKFRTMIVLTCTSCAGLK
jgi:hypothetical protein